MDIIVKLFANEMWMIWVATVLFSINIALISVECVKILMSDESEY